MFNTFTCLKRIPTLSFLFSSFIFYKQERLVTLIEANLEGKVFGNIEHLFPFKHFTFQICGTFSKNCG